MRGTSGNTRPSEALGVADELVGVINPLPMIPGIRCEVKSLGTHVHAGGALRPQAVGGGEGATKNRSE